MLSFWEREIIQTPADLIIIGAGIVGLHTALFYKRTHPGRRVVVLERSNLSYGASTRNAGFACFGSPTELLAELKEVTETELWDVVERRWRGLNRLRQEHGDEALLFENNGGYELFDAAANERYQSSIASLDYFNEAVFKITGKREVYANADAERSLFGFGGVEHLIKNKLEGQINSGAMMQHLWQKCMQEGVVVFTNVLVEAVESIGGLVHLQTSGWQSDLAVEMRAERVAVCTNAFASRLLGEMDIIPARAQVLITNPIENLNWKGTFHYDEGYYYFRNVGQRILFGGARNKAFEEEHSDEIILTDRIQNALDEFMARVIRPQLDYSIDMRWSGIMAMGKDHLLPKIEHLGNGIYVAARCNGMGVAIGIQTAADLNDLLISQ